MAMVNGKRLLSGVPPPHLQVNSSVSSEEMVIDIRVVVRTSVPSSGTLSWTNSSGFWWNHEAIVVEATGENHGRPPRPFASSRSSSARSEVTDTLGWINVLRSGPRPPKPLQEAPRFFNCQILGLRRRLRDLFIAKHKPADSKPPKEAPRSVYCQALEGGSAIFFIASSPRLSNKPHLKRRVRTTRRRDETVKRRDDETTR